MTAPTQQQSRVATYAAYAAAVAAVRSRVARFATGRWGVLTAWRDADAVAFGAAVVPVVLAGQRQVSSLTEAYLSRLLGRPPKGVSTRLVSGAAVRNGVDPTTVYRRPFTTVWTALSQGKPLNQALKEGRSRLVDLAATDLQLAKTHTAQQILQDDKDAIGSRRVLTGPYSCALCVLASTMLYHKADLLPVHPGCDCDVLPVYQEDEVPQAPLEQVHAVVARDLGQKYVDRGGRGEVHYRDILVTHDHGELGPVLAVRDQNFTGPSDLRS